MGTAPEVICFARFFVTFLFSCIAVFTSLSAGKSLCPFFSSSVLLDEKMSLVVPSFVFLEHFSFVRTYYTTYDYIRACCRRASDIYYYRRHRAAHTARTAQHSTAQSTRTSSTASTRRSEGDNASKQTEVPRASMSSSIYTARCVLKTIVEIEICSAYKNVAGVFRGGFACTLCSFSPSFLFRPYMRRPGFLGGPWGSWHLQVATIVCKSL